MVESTVEIRMTPTKGRGLFAKKNFSKGDIIFEEIPLVSSQFAWNEDYGYQACELCLRPLETATENVKRLSMNEYESLPYPHLCQTDKSQHVSCPHCGVKYCSQECLETAWNRYHETLCLRKHERDQTHPLELLKETWKQMHYPPETTSIMLFVKIFAMIHQSEDKESLKDTLKQFCHKTTIENENYTHKVMGLKFADQLETLREALIAAVPVEHLSEWSTPEGFLSLIVLVGLNGQGIGTSSFAEWVKKVKELDLPTEEKKEIHDYIKKIYNNFEEGVGDFLDNEGSGLYKIQSCMNHSCLPNAKITFPNSNYKLAVKATKNIWEGDEICISYLDLGCKRIGHHYSVSELLRENYLFTCACVQCTRSQYYSNEEQYCDTDSDGYCNEDSSSECNEDYYF